jgi:hypothetical protein
VLTSRISSVLAILVLGFATYLLLTSSSSLWFALTLFGLGIALLALTFRVASAFRVRSRLATENRTWLDFFVIAVSVVLVIWLSVGQVKL